ncbi:2-oxoglutarate (2OG) and Fe(II)-dependent oxygenase superfamily protein [Quillaja saponaria]|uniref:2-oxoglutarate (2OG) and Fe(II)-dependent oxygenase superfamily protein n=1 Tax=Quillaja saponaria TaxID=32244 RepID=A0AAD7L8S6_QUISA|nr:2-oxoglutarate (2OG) and Fe(II)-dependent oxygenase superfamily protein [Quillaja saponaria]
MATDFSSIPIINISPLIAKSDDPKMAEDPGVLEVPFKQSHLHRLLELCIAVEQKGHGIPEDLHREVRSITRRIFELACEEKMKIKLTAATGYRGYQRIGQNITEGLPDMQEAIDFCREVTKGMPLNPPNLKPLMEEYISLCTDLARNVMRADLTLIMDDDINVLQVRNLSGEWISAPPVSGSFVCNIGDMLKCRFTPMV